ncbi:MAG: hypothetical protein JXR83_00640 [Deltaproteobacteria bacterium]|nr:hypothetical protein [Deltaproteobacteria bacterium]
MSDQQHDEEIRAALQSAHRDERPPVFGDLVARSLPARAPRRVWALASGTACAAAAACALAIFSLRDACPGAEPATVAYSFGEWQAPTDFLLEIPGRDLLTSVPTFEVRDEIPKIPADLEEKKP